MHYIPRHRTGPRSTQSIPELPPDDFIDAWGLHNLRPDYTGNACQYYDASGDIYEPSFDVASPYAIAGALQGPSPAKLNVFYNQKGGYNLLAPEPSMRPILELADNGYITFDGINDKLIADALNVSGDFYTCSGFVRCRVAGSNAETILSGEGRTRVEMYCPPEKPGEVLINVRNIITGVENIRRAVVSQNVFHVFGWSFDQTQGSALAQLKAYVDGVEVAVALTSDLIPSALENSKFIVGSLPDGTRVFRNRISHIGISQNVWDAQRHADWAAYLNYVGSL